MNESMQTIKEILELIYLASGPVTAFLAFRALGQIREAKNQVSEAKESRIVNAKRDAYTIAADKCEYYLTTIIPLIDNLDTAIEETGVTFFEKSKVEITPSEIKVIPSYRNKEEIGLIFNLPTLPVFNQLESFSLFFTSGVAEDKIGYLTIGETYCNTIRGYLPLIVTYSENKHYHNIIKLFIMWNARQDKERLESEKKKIDKALADNKSIRISPIGSV